MKLWSKFGASSVSRSCQRIMWVSVAAAQGVRTSLHSLMPWSVILFADRPVTCPRWPVFPYHTAVEYLALSGQSLSALSHQSAESANNGDKRNACRFMAQPNQHHRHARVGGLEQSKRQLLHTRNHRFISP